MVGISLIVYRHSRNEYSPSGSRAAAALSLVEVNTFTTESFLTGTNKTRSINTNLYLSTNMKQSMEGM